MKRDFDVCLFFCVNGKFLIHGCKLDEAENYGDFLVYSESHFNIWEKNYSKLYKEDFDFFPRGRITYRKSDETYILYYDKCIENEISELKKQFENDKILYEHDEHYQCHKCNVFYV